MYGYHAHFTATNLSDAVGHFDEDRARDAREQGCPCGGALHVSNYLRKPRGGPPGLSRIHCIRLSFCCSIDGCRRRLTPASIRFLGRRVYFGAVVVLVSAMRHGVTKLVAARLHRLLGVSERTLRRWREWWLKVFTATAFWRSEKARFMPPLIQCDLPRSLIARFLKPTGMVDLGAVLRFLCPLTALRSTTMEQAL